MAVKKVLILGATGMLGHMVRRVLSESTSMDVQGTHLVDMQDPFYFDVLSGLDRLETICNRMSGFDYFINCIGMLPSKMADQAAGTVRKAIKINALFPHELSAFAKERGARVIHISTDGVFSGEAESYNEDDVHDCPDLYGISKSLGEVTDQHFLNLRCSIIGPSPFLGEGLLEWFLKQPAGSLVSGYENHIWHGVSTYQFASLCFKIIEGGYFDRLRRESAVFHFAPNDPVSKYNLLCLFKKIFAKTIDIEATVSDDKIYKRVLQTKHRELKKIFPFGISASRMVSELAIYMNKNRGDNHASSSR
jgi:dTDP-4-dehydrorhamnose reductase